MNAIIRFPSKEAALGLYNDPDYQEAKRIRQDSTTNISMVLAHEIERGSYRLLKKGSATCIRNSESRIQNGILRKSSNS
jgi:hypothetical protein